MASLHSGAVTDAPMVAASHAAHHARHARRVTLIDQRSGSGIDLDRQEPVLGATIRRAVRDDRGG